METVQGRVSRARDNAEEIESNVSKWLSDVSDLVKEVDQLLAADMPNLLNCCNGCCPNIGSRRLMGKEAEEKLMDVVKLKDGCKFDSVGHQTTQIDLFTSTSDSQQFDSRASVFDQIMEALKDDNVYMIGIYGMAGVGKTTMVDQVSKRAKDMKLFDEFAKAVVSQTPDYPKIQRDLAACLNLTLPKESQVQDASLLCRRLKIGKKILLIIDDVWNEIKLEDKIGIPLKDYTKGCKIVFTSRIQDVYVEMNVQRQFQIQGLSESETLSLFENKVGNTIDDSHEIRSLAKQLCGECGGLPLAIITLGAALKDKKLVVWNDTLNQLKSCRGNYIKGMTEKVYRSIELSYEFLEHTDTKACLLYCCLYREDEEICIEDLVWYGVGRRFLSSRETVEAARHRVRTIVDTLKTSCLLLEGTNEDYVKMHDIIRDVALSIEAKDTDLKLLVRSGGVRQWPKDDELQCCRTFSFWWHSNEEFPNVLECPELRTLVLRNKYFGDTQEVPQNFFDVTKKLEVLYLRGMELLASASSISKLVNIRILRLYDCKLENLSFLEELKELEMLIIGDDNIAALTSEVGNLSRLRVLDLRNCKRLKAISTGSISRLSCLEELYLPDKFDKWESEGNARLDELKSLSYLHILHTWIPYTAKASLLLLQEPLCWSLIKFKIFVAFQSNDFEANLDTSYTRILKLEGIDLIGEPMVLMKRAEALELVGLKGLQKAFEDREGNWFLDLKSLNVKNCDDEMEHGFLLSKPKWSKPEIFQEGEGPFGKLKELKMYKCGFKYLFSRSVARRLLQLQVLEVADCDSMEEIVGDDDIDEQVGNEVLVFPQLKTLTLLRLPNLICFYANTKTKSTAQPLFDQKVSFPALEELDIVGLENVAAIWNIQLEDVSSLGLQELFVSHCDKLVNVIVSSACPKLQDRQEGELDMTILPKLKTINLYFLQNIKNFCGFKSNEEEMEEDKNLQVNALFSPKVSTPALKELSVKGLGSITTIWDIQFGQEGPVSFLKLEELSVSRCEKLVNVVSSSMYSKLQADDEMLKFPTLESIKLVDLPNLRCFLRSNEEEKLKGKIDEMQVLFNHKVKLPCLMTLNVMYIPCLRVIWDVDVSTDNFHNLRELEVRNCLHLEEIFRSVEASNEMEEKPADEIQNNLLLLRHMLVEFSDLPELRSIYSRCSTSKVLSSMEYVTIEGCPILEKECEDEDEEAESSS